jgi:hypothetical protein
MIYEFILERREICNMPVTFRFSALIQNVVVARRNKVVDSTPAGLRLATGVSNQSVASARMRR